MPTFKFKFYGTRVDTPTEANLQLRSVQPTMQVKEYKALTVRSGDAAAEEMEISENDIVTMEMNNDVEWHYNAEDFKKLLEAQPGTTRSAVDNLPVVPTYFTSTGTTRGLEEIIKPRAIKIITGMVAKKTAELLVEKMESKLDVGLHGLDSQFNFIRFDKTTTISDKPYLLFIHGTNSNTYGAFCGLKKNNTNSNSDSNAYSELFKFYEGRVLAFEHKTLSESPLKNITDLLNALPTEITVEIISHSRGGLVADLLARCSKSGLPFDNAELKIINENPDFKSLKVEADAANQAASGKSITVSKMVRVAAPSAGTVLIDSRLDNLVNVLCNLIKLIPAAATCMPLGLFLDFARAVIHERTDINVFPGVAAQIPGSPLIRLLNNPNREIESKLFVISGDVEHSGLWKTLLVMSTNLYFGEAHDLVVNSNSMFKGTYRTTNVMERFEQDSTVNHFNYFKNPSSQSALLAALKNSLDIPNYYQNIGISSKISVVHQRGLTGKKPLVYILPGITNSILRRSSNNDILWINLPAVALGRLKALKVEEKDVEVGDLQVQIYGDLMNYLSTDFDVKPFPYDWRMDLTEAGKRLADDIQKELDDKERSNKDIYFIAHSMGGLVLRSMIHTNNEIWQRITLSKKSKVLMLGVPNEGSYSIIRILLGKDAVIKKLALLDFVHSKQDLLDIFKDFTGLLQLLPQKHPGIFSKEEWEKLLKANGGGGMPLTESLGKADEFYKGINDTVFDNEIFRYVAGQADITPEGYDVTGYKISFGASPEGDGRVLWNTIPTTLKSENIYYVNADHGSIPKYEEAFEGFRELLLRGKTDAPALLKMKPVSRGAAEKRDMPDSDFVTIPSESELTTSLLSNTEPLRKTAPKEMINVSVINGDLVHSKYPVVVGHFKGDGIVNAEKYLDQALGFKLSEYHFVNNYPGDIGTHLILLDDKDVKNGTMICKGGVVVGLGEFGALTESKLLVTLSQAFLTLAIQFNELIAKKTTDQNEVVDFGISALTIGSDFGGLRLSTSVKTIFSAVLQANEKLDTMSKRENVKFNYKKINHIEVVEIYQHKSIQVGRVTSDLLNEDGFNNFKFIPPEIRKGSGALNLIIDDTRKDDWHRLEVTVDKEEGDKNDNTNRTLAIRFTAITDKAHSDEKLLPANRLIVDTLVEKLSRHSQWDKGFSQTLYELLVPNNFKGFGSSLHNMVLIVDTDTARYPWELLHDANGISEKPMVINTGIVRQLKSGEQRENIIINSSNRALVIGNPATGTKYPPLPAAENESKEVLRILRENGVEETSSINEFAIDIVQKLLNKSYKIIHIASHGIVGKTAKDPTGVVLGEEIIFTAADFDQIRIVPEFVFINCCSSNVYSPAIEEQMKQKYRLAASVGTQLIRMGVKAAIVTGWEIDDAAAQTFSSCFYTSMFSGKPFGDAVREARTKTFEHHRQTNTWGAYQCYGDPFYTFRNKKSTKKVNYTFVEPIEVIYELDNLISAMTSGLKRRATDQWKEKIEDIVTALPFSWNQHAGIIERLATAYKVLGLPSEAIGYFEQLFPLEDAAYSVKAIEQYCNTKIRFTIAEYKAERLSVAEAENKFNDAIKTLENLKGITLERSSLIAASYRRFYEIKDDISYLLKTAKYYSLAYEHGLKTLGYVDSYPYFNWLHFAILLSDKADDKNNGFLKIPKERIELDQKALDYANLSDSWKPDFFKKTAGCSSSLGLLLQADNKEDIKKYALEIENIFSKAWRKEGNANDRDSFMDYIKSVISLLKKPVPTSMTLMQEKINALENLLNSN